jgi:hypothetical protein
VATADRVLLPVAAAVCLAACAATAASEPAAPPPAVSAPRASSAGGGISREADRALVPIAPPRLRGAVTDGRIALSWDPVGLQILTSYRVRRLEGGGPIHVADVPADPARELARAGSYTLTIAGAPRPGAHTYAVTAIDRDGNESAPARVTVDVRP